MFRATDNGLTGLVAGYYISIKVEKGTPPSGTPIPTPALLSVDFTYDQKLVDTPTPQNPT